MEKPARLSIQWGETEYIMKKILKIGKFSLFSGSYRWVRPWSEEVVNMIRVRDFPANL